MNAVSTNGIQLIQSTLSSNEIRDRIVENERIMDSHLARITRLQMLLNLEEARLVRSQEEQNELRTLLGSPEDY